MYNPLKPDIFHRTTYDDLQDKYDNPWAAFHDGNYVYAALHAEGDLALLGSSRILMGDVEFGMAQLSECQTLGADALLARSFAIWCQRGRDAALQSLMSLLNAYPDFNKGKRFYKMLCKKSLNVLAMAKELNLQTTEEEGIVVRTMGYSDLDDIAITPGDDVDTIKDHLSLQGFEPDLFVFHHPEYCPSPPGFQELAPYTVAYVTDYDFHLYQKYDELSSYDTLMVYGSVEHFEVSSSFGRSTYTYLLVNYPDSQPNKVDDGDRIFDILLTGSSFKPVFQEKAKFLALICQLSDNFNIRINTGFESTECYCRLLRNTKLVPTFVRYCGTYPSRGVEAREQGAQVLYLEKGLFDLFPDVGFIPYRYEKLPETIDARIGGKEDTAPSQPFEFRRRMNDPSGLRFLKYCLFSQIMSVNEQRSTQQWPRGQPLCVVGSLGHAPICRDGESQMSIDNLRKVAAYNENLPKTLQNLNLTAIAYLYTHQMELTQRGLAVKSRVSQEALSSAIKHWGYALSVFPHSMVVLINLARTCYHFGQKADAIPLFETLVRKSKDLVLTPLRDDILSSLFFYEEYFPYRAYVDTVTSLACHHDDKKIERAKSIICSAAAFYLADWYVSQNDVERGRVYCDIAVKECDDNHWAWRLKALLLGKRYKEDDFCEAHEIVAACQRACTLYPPNLHPLVGTYALALLDIGAEDDVRSVLTMWWRYYTRVRENNVLLEINAVQFSSLVELSLYLPKACSDAIEYCLNATNITSLDDVDSHIAKLMLVKKLISDNRFVELARLMRSSCNDPEVLRSVLLPIKEYAILLSRSTSRSVSSDAMLGLVVSLYEKYIAFYNVDCFWEGSHVYNTASELKDRGELSYSQRLFSGLYDIRYNMSGCAFHLGELAYLQQDKRLAYRYFSECLEVSRDHKKAKSYLEYLDGRDTPVEELLFVAAKR